MQVKGRFITIEGVEGAGKSSAVQCIESFLKNKNIDFVLTREPGGTDVAERIRNIVLHEHQEPITPTAEVLLFFAGRAQHIEHVIKPSLAAGKWVVSDRFVDASYAYQGAARGIAAEKIVFLDEWVVGDLKPDLTILLDLPIEQGLTRTQSRGELDRIEQEQQQFFQRARDVYLQRAEQFKDQYRTVDASQTLEKVHAAITAELNRFAE